MGLEDVGPIGDTTAYYRPVQVETANTLTGTHLPGQTSQGILMWTNGNRVRYALESDWLADDVVDSGDIATALDLGSSHDHFSASVFHDGTDLFFAVTRHPGNGVLKTEIYKANSPSNPSSWSLHGTVQSLDLDNGGPAPPPRSGITLVGVPHISGSTWVLPGPKYHNGSAWWYIRAAVWYSSNGGVSWTTGYDRGYYLLGGGYGSHNSLNVGEAPDGTLYHSTAGDPGSSNRRHHWYKSTNGGSTWDLVSGDNSYLILNIPYTHDGTYLYGIGNGIDTVRYNDLTDSEDRTVVSNHLDFGGENYRVCLGPSPIAEKAYIFYNDRIQGAPNQGWQVGSVGFG